MSKITDALPSNEETFSQFIKEVVEREGEIVLNPEWVLKALKLIEDANSRGEKINPSWIRAEKGIWWMGNPLPKEPWMYRKL